MFFETAFEYAHQKNLSKKKIYKNACKLSWCIFAKIFNRNVLKINPRMRHTREVLRTNAQHLHKINTLKMQHAQLHCNDFIKSNKLKSHKGRHFAILLHKSKFKKVTFYICSAYRYSHLETILKRDQFFFFFLGKGNVPKNNKKKTSSYVVFVHISTFGYSWSIFSIYLA